MIVYEAIQDDGGVITIDPPDEEHNWHVMAFSFKSKIAEESGRNLEETIHKALRSVLPRT